MHITAQIEAPVVIEQILNHPEHRAHSAQPKPPPVRAPLFLSGRFNQKSPLSGTFCNGKEATRR